MTQKIQLKIKVENRTPKVPNPLPPFTEEKEKRQIYLYFLQQKKREKEFV